MRFALMFNPPPVVAPNGLADWSLENAVKRHLAEVLHYTGGDQRWAAAELGINASTVYRWLRYWRAGKRVKPNLSRLSA